MASTPPLMQVRYALKGNQMPTKFLLLIVFLLNSTISIAQECEITSSNNPNITHSINPNFTYKWNPDVNHVINPNVTYAINPNSTYEYNPKVMYSINPNVTTRLNPYRGDWTGFFVCTPDGDLIGTSVIANEDVMVIFKGKNWIGHFVTNKKGGYNFFNRYNEWKGFLVPTNSGGFAFFNREKEWVFSLTK
jgi:hypothetical protein